MEQFTSAIDKRIYIRRDVGVIDGQFGMTEGGDGRVRCGVDTELSGAGAATNSGTPRAPSNPVHDNLRPRHPGKNNLRWGMRFILSMPFSLSLGAVCVVAVFAQLRVMCVPQAQSHVETGAFF